MTRGFRDRGLSLQTHGDASPIVYAARGTGDNFINCSFDGYWLQEAAQAYRSYAEVLNSSYFPHNLLVKEFGHFLKVSDRGYFAVEGEPGLGKSAFAAWITAQEQRCAAHFAELRPGASEAAAVVRSLGAQLITTWELHDLAPGGMLSRASGDPAWLASVIEKAAECRDKREAGARIVIVVDALEAAHEWPDRALPFGLPEHLPRGVFAVITARPGRLWNLPPAHVHLVRQRPDRPENLAALRGFVRTAIRDRTRIAQALADCGVSTETFIEQLLERSAGSWVYVHFILESIDLDPAAVLNLPVLPSGLDAFYDHGILPLCRDSPEQESRIALLAALGAAGEPLDGSALCSLAGLSDPALVDGLMRDGLRPFCDVTDDPSGRSRYALHHASLREYLSSPASRTLPDAEAQLRRRIAHACRFAHSRIGDRYLAAWGGLDRGLATLADDLELAGVDGGYALRNLVVHLLRAGRGADVHKLLAVRSNQSSLWYAAHEHTWDTGGFLRDVELARAAAPSIAMQLRYRLIEASVTRAVSALPPPLVNELVSRGIWSPEQAFSRVERVTNRERQVQALLPLVKRLPRPLLQRLLALAATLRGADRGRVLVAVAAIQGLDPELAARAVDLAIGEEGSFPLIGPLVALISHLPPDKVRRLPSHPRLRHKLDQEYVRIATDFLLAPDRGVAIRTTLNRIRRLSGSESQDTLVAALLPFVPEASFDEVINYLADLEPEYFEVLLAALGAYAPVCRLRDLFAALAKQPYERDRPEGTLRALMFRACRTGTDWAADLALWRTLAPRIEVQDVPSVLALVAGSRAFPMDPETIYLLVARIPPAAARRLLDTITGLDASQSPVNMSTRHSLVGALLENLPAAEAQAVAEAEVSRCAFPRRQISLAYLAQHLSADARRPLLDELCKDVSYGLRGYDESTEALASLAAHLAPEELGAVLETAAASWTWNPDGLFEVIAALAPHLPDAVLTQLARDTASQGPDSECFTALSELGKLQSPERRSRTARKGLALARNITNHRLLAAAVREIAPILPPDAAETALGLLELVWNPDWTVPAVEALAPRLADEQLRRALSAALPEGFGMDSWVIARLPVLLSRLAAAGHLETLGHALDEQLKLFTRPDSMRALLNLLPLLTSGQVQEAWDRLIAENNLRDRAEALAVLVPHLPHAERAAAVPLALAAMNDPGSSGPSDMDELRGRARAFGNLLRAGTDQVSPVIRALRTFLRELSACSFPVHELFAEFGATLPPAVTDEALECALAGHRETSSCVPWPRWLRA